MKATNSLLSKNLVHSSSANATVIADYNGGFWGGVTWSPSWCGFFFCQKTYELSF